MQPDNHPGDPSSLTLYQQPLPGGWTLQITALLPEVWRVFYRPPTGPRLDRLWTLIGKDGQDCPRSGFDRQTLGGWALEPLTRTQQAGEDCLTLGAVSCRIDRAHARLTWQRDGQWLAGDRAFGDALRGLGEAAAPDGPIEHFMTARDDDWICGLGDKTGAVNQMGRRFRLAARDALGFREGSDPLYKHWPFWHVRTQGQFYAQLYLNQAEGWVDFGAERSGYYIQPGVTYRRWQAECGDLDYLLLFGRSPAENLALFYRLTGAPAKRPAWACGFQFTSMAVPDAEQPDLVIEDLLAQFRTHRLPLSGFHFGSGYSRHGQRRMAMVWDRRRFPDPAATVARLKSAGLGVAANIKPSIFEDHPERAALEAAGAFVADRDGTPVNVRNWDGPAALLDYSSEAAWDWWRNAAQQRILATGIDCIWNDNNEYELWEQAARCAGFGQPFAFQQVRTALSLLMCRCSLEAQRAQAGDRPDPLYSITRSAVPGCQRYAETWSGDNLTGWEGLRASIDQTNVMALSGLPVTGHDVGGFYGPSPEPELLLRYVQAYCLLPRLVMNSWKPGLPTTVPWLHPEVTDQVRAALELRQRLMPQLLAWEQAGCWLRAPHQLFSGDARLFEQGCDAFMVGNLLVAPVVSPGADYRPVYLPRHAPGWRDFWTDRPLGPGGELLDWPVTRDSLPLFVCQA